jgi:hypothetical protein
MAGKPKHNWPDDDELIRLIGVAGSRTPVAVALGASRGAIDTRILSRGLTDRANAITRSTKTDVSIEGRRPPEASEQSASVRMDGNKVVLTMPAGRQVELGDYGTMMRERGLDPDDWVKIAGKANEWDAMTSDKATGDNRIVRMRQWTITFAPHPRVLMPQPAVHVPPVKRKRVGCAPSERPEIIVVEGDHQIPYQDPQLHDASIGMLETLYKKHRLAEHVFLGDTGDYPTISRHDDHPNAMASVKECIQASYDVLREKREAAPNARARKLKGNHDWRVDSELLKRAERMYGIAPAQRWEDVAPEIPSLHLDRLLHLPELGIELVEDPRGWQHAEVELVAGIRGLVVRHGWLTGASTASTSLQKRGRSIIVGHIHRREHIFRWDPSAECERQAVVCPTMSLVRDERFGHYVTLSAALQGCVIVTRWPDGDFKIEHAIWNGECLRWRDNEWR